MKSKYVKRIVAAFLTSLLVLNLIPTTVFAAPASDIPQAMLNNVYLDALAYTGYDVNAMKNNGTIFVNYGSRVPESIRSNIGYGTGPSGLETVNTASGVAPDISKFESNGLCCASYVSYVYYNYMPNVAGVDTTFVPRPTNPRAADAYSTAANEWISAGKARSISFTVNSDGSGFQPSEEIPIGSLMIYRPTAGGRVSHVAIYAGYYNGIHFVTHTGNYRGPEFSSVENSTKGDTPLAVTQVVVPQFVESNGAIEVYKKDTDGNNLAGAVFVATNVSDSSKQYRIGPTNTEGYAISVDRIPYGDYIVKETVFPTNFRSYGQTEWQVTVSAANNGKVTIQAVNEIIPGICEIVKTSEDGKVEGIPFRIIGNGIDKTASTGNDGKIMIDELKPGQYTVTEVTPDKYVETSSQTITISSGETTTVNFSNILKKWRLEVTKLDAESDEGQAQGNATLEGASYGIYDGDTLVDTYVTDENGSFQTKYYICGDNWTLREISPSEGYLLDTAVYPIGAQAQNYSIELNNLKKEVFEDVIKGKISIIKHTDNGDTQIETPESGAEFKVFLKSAGSFENAKETERATLICDEYGFAETNELPYGTYTVTQTKGWEGREFVANFDVIINKNGETYRYLINNAMFKSYLKIVKTDAETGKIIPYEGVGFQIYKPDGSKVEMKYTYPTVTVIDTFYTTSAGYLYTPEELEYGKGYYLVEVEAPYGYILNKEPVYFDITEENASDENGITVVVKERPNMAQKGKIIINKTGEVFASVKESEEFYQPVYKESGLQGAVYEVTAAEDIITLDGTMRYSKGEIVDTLTTDENGKASTKELYLGKFLIQEKQAPTGYVLDPNVYEVELTYAGQTVEVTELEKSYYNERQKVVIDLFKVMETDHNTNVGNNQEVMSVIFGLYAAEDITAADGKMIPKDGLIELVSCDEKGHALFTTDIPVNSKLYVLEYNTDKHYLISDIMYPVEFNYAGQDMNVVKITVNDGKEIVNCLAYGSVSTTKVDAAYPENKLSGAVFEIYLDANGNRIFDEDIDKLVGEMTESEAGVYLMQKLTCNGYFLYEKVAPNGYVKDDGYYYFEITKDGETVVVENNAGVGFVNQKVKETPKTGDANHFILWIGLGTVALGGIVITALRRYRKSER